MTDQGPSQRRLDHARKNAEACSRVRGIPWCSTVCAMPLNEASDLGFRGSYRPAQASQQQSALTVKLNQEY